MLINKILSSYFDLEVKKSLLLDDFRWAFLLLISLICFVHIEYLDEFEFSSFFPLFSFYIFIDSLIIPFKRIDMFIHHLTTIALLVFAKSYNLNLIHRNVTIPLLKTEYSSIFLASSHFLKRYRKEESVLFNISNSLLFLTFFKYRIYEFTLFFIKILFEEHVYSIIDNDFVFMVGILLLLQLYSLNFFWLFKMTSILAKLYFFKKST